MHLSTLHVVFGLLFSATAAVIEGDRNAYVDVEKMTSYSCAVSSAPSHRIPISSPPIC
jgi:hypothetical protein